MHVALAIAVLTTLVLAEHAPSQPVSQGAARCLLALSGMLVVVWLAGIISLGTARALRYDFSQRRRWLRDFDRWQRLHTGFWLCAVLAIEYGLGWPQLVRVNWHLGQTVLLGDLLILLPVVAPPALVWAVEYDVDRAIRFDTESEPWRVDLKDRSRFVIAQARQCAVFVLLPTVVLLGVRNLLRRWLPEVLANPLGWLLCAAPVVIVILLFPYVLRAVWTSERLADGSLRNRLQSSANRYGIGLRDLLIWNTDDRLVNAAIAGMWSQIRYVFLTDALLRRLDPIEVEAVLAHEAAHIRLHHFPQRLLAVVLPVALWQCAASWPATPPPLVAMMRVVDSWVGSLSPALPPLFLAMYLLVTVGWYSRLLEHQADLWACSHLAPPANGTASSQTDCATVYVRTLKKIAPPHSDGGRRSGWLHPSLQSRINLLRRTAGDPAAVAAVQRRIQIAGFVLLAGAATPLILSLLAAWAK